MPIKDRDPFGMIGGIASQSPPEAALSSAKKREAKRARVALQKAKARVRQHERVEALRLERFPGYEPRIYYLKPRSPGRRRWYQLWLEQNSFRFTRLCWDPADFGDDVEACQIEGDRLASERYRKQSGWEPLTHARGPFCFTDQWPWPSLPPFLVKDALESYAAPRAKEVLVQDMNVSKANRLHVHEFLQACGLDQEFFTFAQRAATPELVIDPSLFGKGIHVGLSTL